MKLIVFFTVFFFAFLFARLIFGYYVDTVPVFEVLLTPLTWLCVICGVLAGVFILIKVIKEFKFKKHKGD